MTGVMIMGDHGAWCGGRGGGWLKGMRTFPRIPVNWWGLMLRAAVAFGILLAGNAARPWGEDNPVAVAGWYLVSCLLIVACTAAWVRLAEGRSWPAFLARPGAFWLGTAIVVPLTLLAHLLYAGIGYLRGEATTEFLGQYPTGWVLAGSVCFAFVRSYILQALPEELIYRGWLADVTRDRPRLTLAWTTAAFTVVHLVSSGGQEGLGDRVVYLALPLGMGLLAGALRLTTGSVWGGVATHGGMHMVNSLMPPLVAAQAFDAAWVLLLGGLQALAAAVILRRRGFSQRDPHIVGC